MITRVIFFLLASPLIFSTCKKEEPTTEENPRIIYGTGEVNFSDLRVGQKSTYKRYSSGTCFMVDIPQFPSTPPDTLYLEVVDMNYEVVTLSERFSEGSNFYQNGITRTFKYNITTEDDFLLIPERDSSALFYFYANDTLRLHPPNPVELTQDHCLVFTPDTTLIQDEIGVIEEFRFFDKIIESQQYAVSCIPTTLSIENGYLLYDSNGLNVSYVHTNADWQTGFRLVQGWRKIN